MTDIHKIIQTVAALAQPPYNIHQECVIEEESGNTAIPHGRIDIIVSRKTDADKVLLYR